MSEWENKFVEFLQKEEAFEKYMDNMNKLGLFNSNPNTVNYPKAYLTSSFNWNQTDEGFQYWANLNLKWADVVGNTTYVA